MRNLLLELRFDGRFFHGWQIQKDDITVQEEICKAVKSVTGEKVNIHGCSRTDAGVHANMYCCNFRTESAIAAEKIPAAMNFYLPESISVYDCREVSVDFHARYDPKAKEYVYRIYNGKYRNPFYEGRALFYPYALDEEVLNREAQDFTGTYDFSAFCSAGTDIEDKTRSIFEASVIRDGELVEFKVKGDGFLYNMVRIMTGTLLDISQGKIEKGKIKEIIGSKDRSRAGVTAPPEGLYLNEVIY
ncbi:MAG: tRNA pseudouridine(38-40) synthase TruA [Clostridiales bacterium]|nr:tRNA pseudouridine(38-40) synthase TruA [Clostridiales bacterium]